MNNIVKHADIFSAPASVVPHFTSSGGFAVVSPKGSKWRIKYKGEENLLTDAEGDARSSIELVVIDAATSVSKTYYKSGFTEGNTDAPDCQSVDGTIPDPASTSPQSARCDTCPQAEWGSRITPAGKKAKACADSLRLAVVPAGDILNEDLGGAMLLRVSATAIPNFTGYNKLLVANGKSFRACITKVGFDPDVSYPKLTFKAGRALTAEEREQVIEMYSRSEALSRMLSEPAQPREDDEEEAPVSKPKAKPAAVIPAKQVVEDDEEAPAPVAAKPKPKAVPKVAAAPAPAPTPVDSSIDEMLADLDLE